MDIRESSILEIAVEETHPRRSHDDILLIWSEWLPFRASANLLDKLALVAQEHGFDFRFKQTYKEDPNPKKSGLTEFTFIEFINCRLL